MRLVEMVGLGLMVACSGNEDPSPSDTDEPAPAETDPVDTDTDEMLDTDTDEMEDTGSTGDTGTLPSGTFVDTCQAAGNENPLLSGTYRGDTTGQLDDLDPGPSSCIGGSGVTAAGPDVIGRVRLKPGEQLVARHVNAGGSLYLVSDCADAITCVDGAEGRAATLRYVNTNVVAENWFLVADTAGPQGEPWVVDVDLSTPAFDAFHDNCAQAAYAAGVIPGTYTTTVLDASPSVNPGSGVCGLTRASSGPDLLLPFDVPPGQVLTVTAPVPGYVVEDCLQPTDTCVTSSPGGALVYRNGGAVNQRVFAVLEAPAPGISDAFDVSVSLTPAGVLDYDTCADAKAATPLSLGTQLVTLQGQSDEINGQGCVSSGPQPDTVLQVEVPAGGAGRLSFDPPVTAYWLDDCDDPNSCRGGGEAREQLSWYNGGDAAQTLYAVLEPAGPAPAVVNVEFRAPIVSLAPVPDSCADALVASPVVGDAQLRVGLSGAENNLDAFLGFCGAFTPLDGSDRIVPIEVAGGERATVTASGDPRVALSMYDDCTAQLACEESVVGDGVVEFLNVSGDPVTVFAVVDEPAGAASGLVTLDIAFDAPDLLGVDTCPDLADATVLGAGTYADRFDGVTSGVAGPACELPPGAGPDILAPVAVPPGQRIDVVVRSTSDQAYLAGDCTDAATCLAGSQVGTGPLSWVNEDAGDRTVTLVLDNSPPEPFGDLDLGDSNHRPPRWAIRVPQWLPLLRSRGTAPALGVSVRRPAAAGVAP